MLQCILKFNAAPGPRRRGGARCLRLGVALVLASGFVGSVLAHSPADGRTTYPGPAALKEAAAGDLGSQAEALEQAVAVLVAEGVLTHAQGHELTQKLLKAVQAYERGRPGLTHGLLLSFLEQVEYLVGVGTLTADQSQGLIDTTRAMVGQIDELPVRPCRFCWNAYEAGGVGAQLWNAGLRVPEAFTLAQNYPNPFNPSTEIRFDLPEASSVRLVVYDASGRAVAHLVDGSMEAGTHAVTWDATGLPSGFYFYQLATPVGRFAKQMLLLK